MGDVVVNGAAPVTLSLTTQTGFAGGPTISSGAGAPSSTPSKVGDIYIDTDADDAWVAAGTASSADWKQATGAGGGGGLSNVVEDTTPQLGGDLDLNGNAITGYGDIVTTNAADYATAAQGATADTAHQPADIGVTVQAWAAVLDATTAAFLAADRTKLDGIETGATADQTGAQIKTAYEAEADTNAYTDAEQTKVGHLTVTQAVDLDAIETRVNALDASVILMGTWDASVGTFPGGGTAQAGESWIVSPGGTVDSVTFVANDRIVAIVDNASTATFAANWHQLDYTDAVLSVGGLTGAVTLAGLNLETGVDFDPVGTDNAPAASTTVAGKVELLTTAELDTGTDTTRAATAAAIENSARSVKLDGIEALADVTDVTNVTAAGALMDSEVDANLKTLVLPANTTISAFGATVVDDANAAAARTTLGAGTMSDVVDDTTPTLGGTLDANAKAIENLGAVEEQVNTVATTGATETLDVSLYGVHDMTMDQNCTFTFSNPAPSGDMSSFVLILRGAFTPTLPASVDWSGAAPTYTTPSVYTFVTVDAGTTWLGAQSGAAFA